MFNHTKYYKDNKDKILEYRKRYSEKIGKAKIKEYNHQYYLNNIDHIKAQNKKRHIKKNRSKEYKKYKKIVVNDEIKKVEVEREKKQPVFKYEKVVNTVVTDYNTDGLITLSLEI